MGSSVGTGEGSGVGTGEGDGVGTMVGSPEGRGVTTSHVTRRLNSRPRDSSKCVVLARCTNRKTRLTPSAAVPSAMAPRTMVTKAPVLLSLQN